MKQENLTRYADTASASEITERFKNYKPEVQDMMSTIIGNLKDSGRLREADMPTLEILAYNLNVWLKARDVVNEHGVTIMTSKGWLRKNPAVDVAKSAGAQALEILKDYGLTALARKKLERGESGEDDSPLANYFRGELN